MRFFETNTKTDEGFELTPDEVQTRFWQSEEGQAWSASPGARLEHVAIGWMMRKLGGWDPDARDDLDEVLEAIHDNMPRRTQ